MTTSEEELKKQVTLLLSLLSVKADDETIRLVRSWLGILLASAQGEAHKGGLVSAFAGLSFKNKDCRNCYANQLAKEFLLKKNGEVK